MIKLKFVCMKFILCALLHDVQLVSALYWQCHVAYTCMHAVLIFRLCTCCSSQTVEGLHLLFGSFFHKMDHTESLGKISHST